MDRRKFIKTIGVTAGATLLSGLGIAKATELFNNKTDDKMKIVVLTGSPRRNGNTGHMAGQFIKGAEEAGQVNWLLVAHTGIIGHDRILVSMSNKHYTNQGIKTSRKL